MEKTRILLVDDHQIVLESLSLLLSINNKIEVVGKVGTAEEALVFLELNEVDLVITDSKMPVMSGTDLCLQIRQRFPSLKVLMLTMVEEQDQIRGAVMAGVSGYLLKNTDGEELYRAIDTIMSGRKFFSDRVLLELASDNTGKNPNVAANNPIKITIRELEVLRLIAQEYSTSEIADKLFISIPTAESHRRNLIQKMGVKGTVGLVLYAVRHHIV